MRRAALLILICLVTASAWGAVDSPDKRKLLAKRPHIEKIVVTGNRSFSEGAIKKKLYSREDGIWQSLGLMRGNRFTKSNLHYDQLLLEYFYKAQGFPDARVDIDFSGTTDNSEATVYVNINEGTRYRIDSVWVSGLIGRDYDKVRSIANRLRPGDYFRKPISDAIKQDVKSYFANSGYPYAVETDTLLKNDNDSTVAVNIRIDKGHLVAFGDLLVDSTITTQRKVFEREVVFKRGDIYSRDRLFESQQRLLRTNLFNYVSLNPPEFMSRRDSLMPDFRVTAMERLPKYVNIGAGAAQEKEKDFLWGFTGAVGNRNINGSGRKMGIESITSFQAFRKWGFVKQHFEFGYTEPYLFRIRMPLFFTFRYEPGVRSLLQKYRIQTIGLDLTVVREFSLWTKLSVSATYEQFRVFDVDTAQARIYRNELGINVDRKVAFVLETDTRPLLNKFNPSYGSLTQYEFDYVGGLLGGDNSFARLVYSWSKYNALGRNGVFASRLKFGWVNAFGKSTEVPTRERFYLGGAYTVRGFGENELGPTDDKGDPAGGEAMGIINLELRKPLFWQIWGSTFVDCGFNVAKFEHLSLRSPAVTLGVGVQWMSPVGPIRVDYGRRTTINHYPAGGTFHYSILYAF